MMNMKMKKNLKRLRFNFEMKPTTLIQKIIIMKKEN